MNTDLGPHFLHHGPVLGQPKRKIANERLLLAGLGDKSKHCVLGSPTDIYIIDLHMVYMLAFCVLLCAIPTMMMLNSPRKKRYIYYFQVHLNDSALF